MPTGRRTAKATAGAATAAATTTTTQVPALPPIPAEVTNPSPPEKDKKDAGRSNNGSVPAGKKRKTSRNAEGGTPDRRGSASPSPTEVTSTSFSTLPRNEPDVTYVYRSEPSAPPKKRGRPKKKTASNKDPKDPSEPSAAPKKRGRPKKKTASNKDPKDPSEPSAAPKKRGRSTKETASGDEHPVEEEESIGSRQQQWEHTLYQVILYQSRNDGKLPPIDGSHPLGWWVRRQRETRKRGVMSSERIDVLNQIGFVWTARSENAREKWERQYNELKAYKREHGHTNVPQKHNLGHWVHSQRARNRLAEKIEAGEAPPPPKGRSCDVMQPEQKAKLDAIGFVWIVYEPWDRKVQELIRYKERYGNCRVPQHWPDNKPLGKWVARQRCNYVLLKQGKRVPLTEERISQLEALGFDWGRENRKRNPGTMNDAGPYVGIVHGSSRSNSHQPTNASSSLLCRSGHSING